MKGIVLSGGSGTRLYPMTRAANKQLLPVYNKPMVYYPLSTLMLAGCRQILLVVNPSDEDSYRRLFGDGAVIYAYWVSDPSAYGVVEFDATDRPVSIVEKPQQPRSHWAVTGLYFYDADACDIAKRLPRSARGELEISDVNAEYLKQGRLTVEKLGRGYAWLDTGTPSSLLRAAQFVETVEDRQGLQIGSPEEVAWRKGYIDDAGLAKLIEPIKDSEYGRYLQLLLARG